MALSNRQRVPIATTILFFFCLALWTYRQAGTGDSQLKLGVAILSALISGGLITYLIYVHSRLRILRNGNHGEH